MERTAGTVSRFARHGQAQGVSYRLGAVERDALDAALELTVVLHRQHDVREAEAARLVDAQVGLAHGADLARQSDFAEDDRLCGYAGTLLCGAAITDGGCILLCK